MSILSVHAWSIPPVQAADPTRSRPQSSSGPPRGGRRLGWWRLLDRAFQRNTLRDIADDPHLLRDVGLTREQVLHEAAKPFWR